MLETIYDGKHHGIVDIFIIYFRSLRETYYIENVYYIYKVDHRAYIRLYAHIVY